MEDEKQREAHSQTTPKRVALLDYMRFVALIFVVMFHYLFDGISTGKISSITHDPYAASIAKYGYLGVDLFFMISGYVIFCSARGCTPDKFAVSRAVRLYPAFVISMLFTSLFALLWGGNTMSVSPPQIFANLTMLAPLFGYPYVDSVYWTLIFEIKFYALVFFFLAFGLSNHLIPFFKVWPFAILAAKLLGCTYLPFLGPYYEYFAAGALFASLKENRNFVAIIGIIICFGLSIEFAMEKGASMAAYRAIEFSYRTIVFIILLYYMAFIALNSHRLYQLSLPLSSICGALTYPIYLIHDHFGYMFLSKFGTNDIKWVIYISACVIVFLCSLLIHKLVEERLGKVWRDLFDLSLGAAIRFLLTRIIPVITVHKNKN